MTPLETELQHMLAILCESATSFRAWKGYLEDKALKLANWHPQEHSQLPMMLAAEISRLESKHSPPRPRTKGTP